MKLTVLALDPGGTTGWARYEAEVLPVSEHYDVKWSCGQLGPDPHHNDLWTLLEMSQTQVTHVVSESFEYRNRSRPGLVLDSVEYIGVTKLFVQQRMRSVGGNIRLHMQTASQAKGFVSDDKIKKLDLWSPGNKHAMDATRHLLYFLVTQMKRYEIAKAWK